MHDLRNRVARHELLVNSKMKPVLGHERQSNEETVAVAFRIPMCCMPTDNGRMFSYQQICRFNETDMRLYRAASDSCERAHDDRVQACRDLTE